jgi:hypothetical protein
VLRGSTLLPGFSIGVSNLGPISVYGKGATVAGGAGDPAGLEVKNGATVTARDLRFTNTVVNPAVNVFGGATLHMSRCWIVGNIKGGLHVDGATIDITNTVIAGNMARVDPGCQGWAGVCLNNVAGASRFVNNTVGSNTGTGVTCGGTTAIGGTAPITLTGSILYDTLPFASCGYAPCCDGVTPGLTSDYHLMPGSACIDKLENAMSVATDIDGQPRPYPAMTGKSDCGADEYWP